jgi:tRNA nucleotidyltransferase (CCA-adding enzyme)
MTATMREKNSEQTRAAVRRLFPAELHARLFLVGGSVRDLLLGKTGGDLDLLAVVRPEELLPLGFRPVTPRSAAPIYFLFRPGLGKIEVTLLDRDLPLPEELLRRDFRANAMAMDLDGGLIDPLGGRNDLESRTLRPCSERTFRDDPLRIFRGFRFEADGWRLAPEAEGFVREREWGDALREMPVERFSGELLKALDAVEPTRFFRRMAEFGIGWEFLPELFRMAEVPAGPVSFHPEGDLFSHSLAVLERMASRNGDVTPRFCALFHDLGKLATSQELYPRHHGHDRMGAELAADFCRRLRLPASLGKALACTCRLHLVAGRWSELRTGTRIRTAEEALAGGIASFLPLLVAADHGEEGRMPDWETALEVARLSARQLGIEEWLVAGDGRGGDAIPAAERSAFVRARKVEEYRRRIGFNKD